MKENYSFEMLNISKQKGHDLFIDDISFQVKENTNISIKCSEFQALMLIDIINGKTSFEGEIRIKGRSIKSQIFDPKMVSYIFREESYYKRLTVKEYLLFFAQLVDSSRNYSDTIKLFRFDQMENNRINRLSFSEKRRLSFARSFISGAGIIVVHEPLYNLDRETQSIILNAIGAMSKQEITIIALSTSLEDALLFEGITYAFENNQLKVIDLQVSFESDTKEEDQIDKELEIPQFKIDKIPAKVGDKIILINPFEINYIEADAGTTYIYFANEKVACTFTMANLEKRLEHFGFFRSHRSYLVNLQKIREVVVWTRNSYSLVLDDKKKSSIPLSKGRLEELKALFKI